MECSLAGCYRESYCRRLCKPHYNKQWAHGDVRHNGRLYRRKPIKYSINDKGCFECYSHAPNAFGYPEYHFNNKKTTVHRYIYEECFGYVDKGLFILHSCDNRRCINPEHLRVGTHLENMKDMTARGRQCKGSDSPHAKLTEVDIVEIRSLIEKKKSDTEIARKFNVSRTTIGYIRRGKTWTHVN